MSSTGSTDETMVTSGARTREPPAPLDRGDTVGRYVVIDRLGEGGMGVVCAAYDPELDRKLAIKLLRAGGPEEAATEGTARLQREARAMARLQHPNVIAVHDVGEHAGQVFVAMEFVDGVTLRAWTENRDRDWREVLAVLTQAGRGLVAAHDKGLIHRDFKSENVMVGGDGRVRVLDFGLARAGGETTATSAMATPADSATDVLASDLTRVGAAVGTPAYMSPEQHAGEVVDARSDQFSFCVALYEALYGERPFAGDTAMALAFHTSQGQVRDGPANTRVPGWVRRVVLRGLSVEPGARYPSMQALLQDLGRDPTRRRRRWAAVLGLVLAGGSAYGINAVSEARALEACRTEGSAIGETWNDGARAQLEEALVATRVAYAATTRARTVEWIDRHAGQWSAARTAVCVQHDIDGTGRPELRLRAESCLQESRDALQHLLEMLTSGGETSALRAVRAAASLPPPRLCTDEGWLSRRVALPDDAATRDAIAAVRRQLAGVVTLLELGRYDDAVAAGREAVQAANETGWEPLVARALVDLGAALERTAKFDEARDRLHTAYVTASGAGDDVVAIHAGGLLAFLAGHRMQDADRAALWRDISGATLRRAGLENTLRGASWTQSIAATHFAAGEFKEAQELYRRAEAIRARELGAEHPATLTSGMNVAVTLTRLAEYEEARALLEANLEVLGRAVGPQHPDVATELGTLAQACKRLGDDDAALEHARRALQINEAALGPEHPTTAQGLVNVANATEDDEEKDRLYRRALPVLEQAVGANHPWIAAVLNNLALVRHRAEDLKEARELLERALEIQSDKPGPDHPATARTMANLAAVLRDQGDHAAAVVQAEKALAIRARALGKDHPETAATRFLLARALWQADTRSEDRDRARTLATEAEAAFEAAEAPDQVEEVAAWLAERP